MWDNLILIVAAFCAGILNTIAGGGTFLTFPALVYAGVPVVAANATSAVAVFPGYLGGAVGFKAELASFDRRVFGGSSLPRRSAGLSVRSSSSSRQTRSLQSSCPFC